MNELQVIENKIYEIRGVKVMFDFDLAEMYQMENKYLKRAVKRNIVRFPADFMFELTKEEWEILRCNFGTSSWGGSRYQPFVFTEQGVAMLSSVLGSETAVQINISIMRAFVAVRQFVLNAPVDKTAELKHEIKELKEYIEEVFTDYNDINEDTRMQLELINETLAEMQAKSDPPKPRRPIGYMMPDDENK